VSDPSPVTREPVTPDHGPVVLVVEDDPDILELMLIRLGCAGYRVVGAADAGRAVRRCRQHRPPDVLVLDIGLPDLSGLLPVIRQQPGCGQIGAIFVTARVLDEDVRRGSRLGAQYLTKPFQTAALLRAIEVALQPGPSARLTGSGRLAGSA
jgi:CheY-like chemotaxis protein